jgi:hypothetical protein
MTSPARLKRHLDQKTSVFNFTFGIIAALSVGAVQTRDDGRYTQSPLKPLFDSLRARKGPCCSVADGFAVSRTGRHVSRDRTSERYSGGPQRGLVVTRIWSLSGSGSVMLMIIKAARIGFGLFISRF